MTTEQYSIGYDSGYQDGFDAALAEPVKQEPVGEVVLERMGVGDAQIVRFQMYGKIPPVGTKLYAAPVSAKCEWVELTDDEELELAKRSVGKSRHWLVAEVIAAFKETNK